MSDELIVIFTLGTGAVILLCSTIAFLGYQLARTMETVLKFNHKEERDQRALSERLLEMARTPSHLTQDMAILHAKERNAQVVVEAKADTVVNRDPIPETKLSNVMFTTDPDVRGHYS